MPVARRNLIKKKLNSLFVIGSAMALLVAFAAFALVDLGAFHNSAESNLSALADMMAAESYFALASKNPAHTTEAFQTAASTSSIATVVIYNDHGTVFATYIRDDLKGRFAPPAQPSYGLRDEAGLLTLVQPIILDGKRLGTIYVQSDNSEMHARLKLYGVIGLVALLFSSLLAFRLASRALTGIFSPIKQLVGTMRLVAKEKNYSIRAYQREDELGELIEAFNGMLAQIQQRDTAMEKAKAELESRMQERAVERTKLEQQLLQAQKMEALGQLAGGIAHDFNNLLTVIMGNLSLARIQAGPDGKIAGLLQAAEQGTHRASDVTRQLLAVGRRTFNVPKTLDLQDVVTDVVAILKRTIDPRIVIETPASELVWLVHADSGQLFQALMNLCVNARDAMPDGGRLRIEIKNVTRKLGSLEGPAGSYVRLIVTDTGIGMEPEVCRRIFEPFFTTKEVGKGTGLGLAMVYGIVGQNKGTITVESKPGEGSRFTIELPRYTEVTDSGGVEAEVLADPYEPRSVPEGSGETILVVEDEDAIRKLARRILEELGYVVLEAEDGVRGMSVYEEHQNRIHAVILDLTMPKKSGLEVLAALRHTNPEVRVILSSGYSAAAQKLDLPKLGVKAFLQKPYVPNELARTLRTVLEETA